VRCWLNGLVVRLLWDALSTYSLILTDSMGRWLAGQRWGERDREGAHRPEWDKSDDHLHIPHIIHPTTPHRDTRLVCDAPASHPSIHPSVIVFEHDERNGGGFFCPIIFCLPACWYWCNAPADWLLAVGMVAFS